MNTPLSILKEYSKFVTKEKLKNVELIGQMKSDDSHKVQKLYEALYDLDIVNEDQMSNYLYNDSAKNLNYGRLKQRLENKLINSVLLVKHKVYDENDIMVARKECFTQLTVVRILQSHGQRRLWVDLCKKLLKKAQKFDFTEASYFAHKQLWLNYVQFTPDRKKAAYHKRKYLYFKEAFEAEEFLYMCRVDIIQELISNKIISEKVSNKLNSLVLKMETGVKRFETFKFYSLFYLTTILVYELTNRFDLAIQKCEEAIAAFKSKKGLKLSIQIAQIQTRKLSCYAGKFDFESGNAVWENHIKAYLGNTSKPLNGNQFASFLLYLKLCMHSKNYQKAFDTYLEYKPRIEDKYLLVNATEMRILVVAYFEFLISIGLVQDSRNTKSKFRLSKFLNDIPAYSKEKRGYNIPLLILQLLFLVQRQQFSAIYEKVDALKMYCSRYLKEDGHFRSNCFIKMLLLLPEAQYHRQAFIRKTVKLHKRLLAHPLKEQMIDKDLEVIPYEDLWEILLNNLENKIPKLRSARNRN